MLRCNARRRSIATAWLSPTIHLGGHTIGSMIRPKPAQSESVRADGIINSSELRVNTLSANPSRPIVFSWSIKIDQVKNTGSGAIDVIEVEVRGAAPK
jgi:hypothetical protein